MKLSSINLDITHRCLLQCPKCRRQKFPGMHKRGHDITLESMKKISDQFEFLIFCGQFGDPIYHPQFFNILEICKDNKVSINTAGAGKSLDWFEEAAMISKNQSWTFALDGLPHQSHQYRIGQDGEKVFEVMKHLSSLGAKVFWQYIVFKYNQDSLDEAIALSKKHNIEFVLVESSRWDKVNDPYKPDRHYQDRPEMFD